MKLLFISSGKRITSEIICKSMHVSHLNHKRGVLKGVVNSIKINLKELEILPNNYGPALWAKLIMSRYNCVRHALCCVNLIFWILGCGMLGVGIWMHLVYEGYATLLPSFQMLSADSLVITAGIITFLVGFLGCCGSWFQSKCLLRTYFTMVIIILLLEFTAGTLGFLHRKHVSDVLQDELLIGLKERYTIDNRNGLAETWDHIQIEFQCCGVQSYEDWFGISAWPEKKWVPLTCCTPQYSNITSCSRSKEISHWFLVGCYTKLHTWMMERLYIVGIVCLAFAFIQLFGIISALIIICSLGDRRK